MFLKFRERAGQTHRKVILPEADDIRILLAAKQVDALGIAQPILLGDPDKIKALARANSLDLTGISFLSAKEVASDAVREYLISRKAYRTTSEADIQTALSSPLTLACCLLGMDEVDACVAGAVASTKQVIGQALKIIGMTEEGALLSSFLILTSPVLAQHGLEHILFADCAINIDPDAKQLSQIAIATAQSAQTLLDLTPKVAMLSFSTAGSAGHPQVDKVVQATARLKKEMPSLKVIGEVQFDAAFMPDIRQMKMPNASFKEAANIYIFPDLASGNIGYKIAERIGGAQVVGPILQGLRRPLNDLSRGASVDSIVDTIALTCLQAEQVT